MVIKDNTIQTQIIKFNEIELQMKQYIDGYNNNNQSNEKQENLKGQNMSY